MFNYFDKYGEIIWTEQLIDLYNLEISGYHWKDIQKWYLAEILA